MLIKDTKFIKSAASKEGFLDGGRMEIAVAGKSNVGKSSFINMLVNRNHAARVSNTPGRTRLVNYFDVLTDKGEFVLTDLPGYGFAKVSKEEKANWGKLMEGYFETVGNVRVFVLIDIRHGPSYDDIGLIEYLYFKAVPFYIVANKSDKLSRSQIQKAKKEIAATLKTGDANIIVVSSLKKTGREDVLDVVERLMTESLEVESGELKVESGELKVEK